MTITVMHLNVFGIHCIKKIDVYSRLEKTKSKNILKEWFGETKANSMEDKDIVNDQIQAQIEYEYLINDNLDICIKMKKKD